jgi:hypothetical protein
MIGVRDCQIWELRAALKGLCERIASIVVLSVRGLIVIVNDRVSNLTEDIRLFRATVSLFCLQNLSAVLRKTSLKPHPRHILSFLLFHGFLPGPVELFDIRGGARPRVA